MPGVAKRKNGPCLRGTKCIRSIAETPERIPRLPRLVANYKVPMLRGLVNGRGSELNLTPESNYKNKEGVWEV